MPNCFTCKTQIFKIIKKCFIFQIFRDRTRVRAEVDAGRQISGRRLPLRLRRQPRAQSSSGKADRVRRADPHEHHKVEKAGRHRRHKM